MEDILQQRDPQIKRMDQVTVKKLNPLARNLALYGPRAGTAYRPSRAEAEFNRDDLPFYRSSCARDRFVETYYSTAGITYLPYTTATMTA